MLFPLSVQIENFMSLTALSLQTLKPLKTTALSQEHMALCVVLQALNKIGRLSTWSLCVGPEKNWLNMMHRHLKDVLGAHTWHDDCF